MFHAPTIDVYPPSFKPLALVCMVISLCLAPATKLSAASMPSKASGAARAAGRSRLSGGASKKRMGLPINGGNGTPPKWPFVMGKPPISLGIFGVHQIRPHHSWSQPYGFNGDIQSIGTDVTHDAGN